MRKSLAALALLPLLAFPVLALADAFCTPATNPSQRCMGTNGPIVVGKGSLPICITGCVYAVSDVANGQEVSASFNMDACNQYDSFVTYQGHTAYCDPGDSTVDVIPSIDSSWTGPIIAQQESGGSAAQDSVAPTLGAASPTLTVGDAAIPGAQSSGGVQSAAQQTSCDPTGVLSLLGLSCGSAAQPLPGAGEPQAPQQDQSPLQALYAQYLSASTSASPVLEQESAPLLPQGAEGSIDVPQAEQGTSLPVGAGEGNAAEPAAPAVQQNGGGVAPQSWIDSLIESVVNFLKPPRHTSESNREYMAQAADVVVHGSSQSNNPFAGTTYAPGGVSLSGGTNQNASGGVDLSAPSGNYVIPKPTISGANARCDGGTVIVYSKDFAGMSDASANRPAHVKVVHCLAPLSYENGKPSNWQPLSRPVTGEVIKSVSPLTFLYNEQLPLSTACSAAPPSESNCTLIYVADVSKDEITGSLRSASCKTSSIAIQSWAQFSMCSDAEAQIRNQYANKTVSTVANAIQNYFNPSGITPMFGQTLNLNTGTQSSYGSNNAPMSGAPNAVTVPKVWGGQFTKTF